MQVLVACYTTETESTIEAIDKIIVTNIIPITPATNSFFLDISHPKGYDCDQLAKSAST
jgi:hypothetical protein